MTDEKILDKTVEKPSFMIKLTDLINEECNAGTFAETIIGVMRRVETRLLMAAEKATAAEKAEKINQQNAEREAKKDQASALKVAAAPKGINT